MFLFDPHVTLYVKNCYEHARDIRQKESGVMRVCRRLQWGNIRNIKDQTKGAFTDGNERISHVA